MHPAVKRRRLLRVLVFLTLLTAVLLGAVGWVGSSRLISPPRRVLQNYHTEILAAPAEHGLAIEAWTAPRETPALIVRAAPSPGTARKSLEHRRLLPHAPPWGDELGTVVLLHGHRGRKEDHLPICERFCAAGFRCVLIDLPGHGDHPAPYATFGHHEVPLLAEIHDALEDGRPFFLFGVSQGGAIALQAAARQPERWQGVVSVAAFAGLDEAMRSATRDFPSALRPATPLLTGSVALATRLRAGFSPAAIRPLDLAPSIRQPALLIHGTDDRFIPADHARRLDRALASEHKQLLLVPAAGHARVLAADADRTYVACSRFLLELASKEIMVPGI